MLTDIDDNNFLTYFREYLSPNVQIEEVNETVNNFSPFLDLNEKDFIQQGQILDFSSSFTNFYIASNLDNTNCETIKKNNNYSPKKDFIQEDESNYNFISLEKISNIFKNHNFTKLYDIINNSKNITDIKNVEYKLCNKKRKRELFVTLKKEEVEDKIK